MEICKICNKNPAEVYPLQVPHCLHCHKMKTLPRLYLVKHWDRDTWYNPDTARYVHDAIEKLGCCQFHVFNHKTYFSKFANPAYREMLVFRYFGAMACKQIPSYPWSNTSIECKCTNCV